MGSAIDVERGVRRVRLWHARWTGHRKYDAANKGRSGLRKALEAARAEVKQKTLEAELAQSAFKNRTDSICEREQDIGTLLDERRRLRRSVRSLSEENRDLRLLNQRAERLLEELDPDG